MYKSLHNTATESLSIHRIAHHDSAHNTIMYYYSMHVENFDTLLRICRSTVTEVDRVRSFIVVLSVEMRMRK